MVGIQDSAFRSKDFVIQERAKSREAERRSLEREFAPKFLIADWDQSVANPERQQGKMKSFLEFEKELQTLNPNIRIIPNGGNPSKALVFHGSTKLFPCERIMPEFSVMHAQVEEKPIIYDGIVSLDAPATETVTRVWREVSRGWRTVLTKLILDGYLSEALVEKKFGTVDRATWARLMGKQEGSLF